MSKAHRRHDDAEHAFERDGCAVDCRKQPQHRVDEMHESDQHDQHRANVEQQFQADRCPAYDGVHCAVGDRSELLQAAARRPPFDRRLRHHDQADHDRGRSAEHGGHDKVARSVRNDPT